MMGEAPPDFLVRVVPAGHVMNDNHAGIRPGAERSREVGVDRVVLVSAQINGFRKLGFVSHCSLLSVRPRKTVSGREANLTIDERRERLPDAPKTTSDYPCQLGPR